MMKYVLAGVVILLIAAYPTSLAFADVQDCIPITSKGLNDTAQGNTTAEQQDLAAIFQCVHANETN